MAEQGKSCSKRRKKGNKPTGKKKIRIAIVLGKLRVQNFKRWWLTMSNNLKVKNNEDLRKILFYVFIEGH